MMDNIRQVVEQQQQRQDQYNNNNQSQLTDGTTAVATTSTGTTPVTQSTAITNTTTNNNNDIVLLQKIIILFLPVGIGGLLFGYDISVTSFVISSLQDLQNNSHSWNGNAFVQGIIVSSASFGAFIGSFCIYYYQCDTFIGRQYEIQLSSICYLLGSIIEYISGYCINNNDNDSTTLTDELFILLLFLFGRLIYGIGISFAMHGGPTYLSEMSPPTIRGTVISLKEASIVTGILFGYIIGYYNTTATTKDSNDNANWQITYLYTIPLAVVMLLLSKFIIPESYRWLVLRRKYNEAYVSLQFLYPNLVDTTTSIAIDNNNTTNDEEMLQRKVESIIQSISQNHPIDNRINLQTSIIDNDDSNREIYEPLLSETTTRTTTTTTTTNGSESQPLLLLEQVHNDNDDETNSATLNNIDNSIWLLKYRQQIIVGFGLVILQQITGQPSVLSYAPIIIQHTATATNGSGTRSGNSSGSITILIALFKLITTVLAASTVEYFGRKKLFYIGNTCMIVSLLILSTTVSFTNSNSNSVSTDDNDNDNTSTSTTIQSYIVLVSLLLYIGGYQFSFGPITWLLISEIFTLQIRGQAIAIAVQINFLFNTIVQFCIPLVQYYIGFNILFNIFAVLTCYSIFFVYYYVPETKGLTLEQIERRFQTYRN